VIYFNEMIILRILSLTPCFSGVFFAGRIRKTVFNGFYTLSQTAEAVRNPSTTPLHPAEAGCY
jgi:hypothetical protein